MASVLRNLLNIKPSYLIAKIDSPAAMINLELADKMAEEGTFPILPDLVPAVYVALVLCFIRWGLHKSVFRPLAIRALKLEAVVFNSIDPAIETAYKKNKKASDKDIEKIASQVNLSVEAVQQEFWLRRRRDSQELRITKFVEALWRCIFYTFFSFVGFFTLYFPERMPWIEPTASKYFNLWPVEPLRRAVQTYYLLELGSYIHQLLWTDVSRSDSAEMMAHHVITILLIAVSYVYNFMRIGTVIMAIHDVPDVFLEAGKCMNYVSKAKGGRWLSPYTDAMFGIFASLFFVTRIVIYPLVVYGGNITCSEAFGEGYPTSYLFFITLLLLLQCLHIFWFYLIVRMAYRLLWLNGGVDDIRSDDDDEAELAHVKEAKAAQSPKKKPKSPAVLKKDL